MKDRTQLRLPKIGLAVFAIALGWPASVLANTLQTPNHSSVGDTPAALVLSLGTCGVGVDDVFEDNDLCTTPAILGAGSYANLHSAPNDSDFYNITIPPRHYLDIVETSDTGATFYTMFSSTICLYQITGSSPTGLTISNPSPISSYTVQLLAQNVTSSGFPCSDYGFDVIFRPDECMGTVDDALEDNDTCETATPIVAGSYTNLVHTYQDDDFYSISIPGRHTLELTETADSFFMEYLLFETGCGDDLRRDAASFSYTNSDPNPETYIIEARRDFWSSLPSCSEYAFDVTLTPDPCNLIADDAMEPNNSCAEATPIAEGTYTGLHAKSWDADYYSFCLQAGESVSLSVTHPPGGNLDIFLYDTEFPGCGEIVPYASSETNAPTETINWLNNGGSDTELTAVVRVRDSEAGSCNNYDLTLQGGGDCSGAVATAYCIPMNTNSTGNSTLLLGTHGNGVGSGLHLFCQNGPPGQFGYVLVGTGASAPGTNIGQGRLCLRLAAPNILGRYNVAGTDQNSLGQFDNTGFFQNLSGTSAIGHGYNVPATLPFPGSPAVQDGATYYFQLWHRDVGSNSNFSNAVAARF